jgi:hypothetical protein
MSQHRMRRMDRTDRMDRMRRMWALLPAVAAASARRDGPSVASVCAAGAVGFLGSVAHRSGVLDRCMDGATKAGYHGWMRVCVPAVCAVSIYRSTRSLAAVGALRSACFDILLLIAGTASGAGIGSLCTLAEGCAWMCGWIGGALAVSLVALPLRDAWALTSARPGDIVIRWQRPIVDLWVVLTPLGDGRGRLASHGCLVVTYRRPECTCATAGELCSHTTTPLLTEPQVLADMRRSEYAVVRTGEGARPGLIDMVALLDRVRLSGEVGDCELLVASWRMQRPVRDIQRAWRRAMADPGFALCRARLRREAAELLLP